MRTGFDQVLYQPAVRTVRVQRHPPPLQPALRRLGQGGLQQPPERHLGCGGEDPRHALQ